MRLQDADKGWTALTCGPVEQAPIAMAIHANVILLLTLDIDVINDSLIVKKIVAMMVTESCVESA